MRRSLVPLIVAALAVPTTAPAGADMEARWLTSSALPSAVRLLADADQATVHWKGHSAVLPLGERSHLEEVVTTRNGWVVAGSTAAEEGRELLLFAEIDGQLTSLPVPAGRDEAIRDNPVLLTENEELVGMVWLQGDDQSSYRIEYAEWRADDAGEGRWRHRGRLIGRGPGSQLALDAVVLDDGSWLAVWSRYDRNDDEIYWSRRQNGEWSEPTRVSADNSVPDIVPALTTVSNEALLAWSRYDGEEYRLWTARFTKGEWVDEVVVGAGGSAFPSWHDAPGGISLVYRQALPSSWVWMEFDNSGRTQRYSVAPGGPDERPVPTFEAGEAQFLFPSGHREAARWTSAQ